jgi:hypothetical protein
MSDMDDRPDPVRVVIALVAVVAAAIALLVGVGAVVARVAPDIGGDDIVEPDEDTPEFSDATALLAAIDCPDPASFEAFDGLGPEIRSYALPTAGRCASTGTLAFVYVDADDRYTAEDDNDVADRICSTVAPEEEIVSTTVPTDPAATVAPTETTVAVPTTTIPDTVFGLVRGPNWILATASGEGGADALASNIGGGVVFTKTCEGSSD